MIDSSQYRKGCGIPFLSNDSMHLPEVPQWIAILDVLNVLKIIQPPLTKGNSYFIALFLC